VLIMGFSAEGEPWYHYGAQGQSLGNDRTQSAPMHGTFVELFNPDWPSIG